MIPRRPLVLKDGTVRELPDGDGLEVESADDGQFLVRMDGAFRPAQILVEEVEMVILVDETTGQVLVDG